MKVYVTQFGILLVIACVYGSGPHYDEKKAPELFMKFINDYNRSYKNDQDLMTHYEAFKHALHEINRLNQLTNIGAVFDINHFSDYTYNEIKDLLGHH